MRSHWKSLCLGLLLVSGLLVTPSQAEDAPKPEKVGLWNGPAPVGDDRTEEVQVWLTVYRPAHGNGAAMVICPGGGYGGHAIQPEGHGIAAWLNRHGIAGAVLEYRLPKGRHDVPLLDAQRAMRTVRARAKEWQIDPGKIGIIGFSAGGHLASTALVYNDAGNPEAKDPIERASSRPDFGILVYPVITMDETTHAGSRRNLLGESPSPKLVEAFSSQKWVTDKTPPTFLAHPLDDKVVAPANSKMFADALKARGVAVKYLELPSGGHGLNGYKGPSWDAWQKESLEWLSEFDLLPRSVNETK